MANGEMTLVLDEGDFQKLMNNLKGVEKIDQDTAIQTALLSGMQNISNKGKANLASRNHQNTGNLMKSFAVKFKRKTNTAYGGFKRSTRFHNIGGGNHAHLVDRGTVKRGYHTKSGAWHNTGSVSANHPQKGSMFWTDAVERQGKVEIGRVMDTIYEELGKIMSRN